MSGTKSDAQTDVIKDPDIVEAVESTIEDFDLVQLNNSDRTKKAYIGHNLSEPDMPGIPKDIATHKLNVDPLYPPVRQIRRKFNTAINEAVQKLTGRIDALSRFISRSSDRCHKFFNELIKDNGLQCNSEFIEALRELKTYLSSPPLLAKAEPGERLLVYLPVSEVAIPRAQNIEADGLAKLEAATRNITKENVVTLLHSSIDQLERTFGGPLAKCLGPNQKRRVLEEVYEGHCGAHTGSRALIRGLIRGGYYWPTMNKEAADYVKKDANNARNMHL
ncbi:PREDICTED: uncharacterized protein LOC109238582 [Nicotiana attenuata]|uniref:uncharacterized protein LOC109238582 n=1 Tax=Nicotiana attenuata TaxID=49451 RepID=UPI0009054F00|nr:PREDICTED: uncharacterized protein LOC109238582 [Nicotiana attenuata]